MCEVMGNCNSMSIEELIETKELIEDVIAEKEVSMCAEVESPTN